MQLDCYTRYQMQATSDWSDLRLNLQDSGASASYATDPPAGFDTMDAFRMILTHPVDGAFRRLDGRLGGYSVWHKLIPLTQACVTDAYFGIFERLGLLTPAEMQHPLSALVCARTQFTVLLPPRRL